MSEPRRKWLFHERSPAGRLWTRCTACLTLAAYVLAVPGAVAQQPGQRPPMNPASSPYSSAPPGDPYAGYSSAGASYAPGQSAGAGYGGGSARALEVILRSSGVPN